MATYILASAEHPGKPLQAITADWIKLESGGPTAIVSAGTLNNSIIAFFNLAPGQFIMKAEQLK